MKNQIQLGDLVKDDITGYEGIVVAQGTFLNGCERILIQPQKLNENNEPVLADWFDIQTIVFVKETNIPVSQKDNIAHLGDVLKDTVSDYQGVCVAEALYISGKHEVGIQQQKLKKNGDLPKLEWFEVQRTQVITARKYAVASEPEPVPAKKKPGGPPARGDAPR